MVESVKSEEINQEILITKEDELIFEKMRKYELLWF